MAGLHGGAVVASAASENAAAAAAFAVYHGSEEGQQIAADNAGSAPISTAPQPLHLCAPPADPIEDEYALARHGIDPKDEYTRYFNDLNAYLICLQKSQADIIEKGRFWHDRYSEQFPPK